MWLFRLTRTKNEGFLFVSNRHLICVVEKPGPPRITTVRLSVGDYEVQETAEQIALLVKSALVPRPGS